MHSLYTLSSFNHLSSSLTGMPPKPKGKSRNRASASKCAPRRTPAQPQPAVPDESAAQPSTLDTPTASGNQPLLLSQETLLEGIYQRMRRDGLLDFGVTPPATAAPTETAVPPPAPSTPAAFLATMPPAPPAHPAASALTQILAGESAPPGESAPLASHALATTLSTPLAAHVSARLKEKIWEGRAIDMRSLLIRNDFYADSDSDDERPKKRAKASKREPGSNPALQIAEFSSAFLTYTAIIAERHPDQIPGLLKHLSTVQRMARELGHDAWRAYDQRFRVLKQHDPSLAWGLTHIELYTEVAIAHAVRHAKPAKQQRPFRAARSSDAGDYPRRYNTCYVFQRDGSCPLGAECPYGSTHSCYECKGRHATRTCSKYKAKKAGTTDATSSSNGSKAKKPRKD